MGHSSFCFCMGTQFNGALDPFSYKHLTNVFCFFFFVFFYVFSKVERLNGQFNPTSDNHFMSCYFFTDGIFLWGHSSESNLI